MHKNPRYTFPKIFWVILTLCSLLILLGMLGTVLIDKSGAVSTEFFSNRAILRFAISILLSTTFYYFTLNRFDQLIVEKASVSRFIPSVLLALAAAMFYNIGVDEFLPHQGKGADKLTLGVRIFANVFATIMTVAFALMLAYLNNLRDEKKQRKVLEEQKLQLEIEKSQANLNFLKAQINPHFLHNTLNFLYAKSLPYSTELSEGILTLSDIMRYALSEGNALDGKAPLKDEIEHVRNVIKINQLRFSNNLNVQFEVNGVVDNATIIPFVLITIVENAFKHGDLKSPEHPIEIHLNIVGKRLHFYCRNKKKTGPKELSTGIGLANIRNRLDLAYGKAYLLQIKDVADIYTTELIITEL